MAASVSVEVRIELGHRAKIRDYPTENGHTHDWLVYVKGYEGISLGSFVEKVVFHLHDTYDQPRRVVKQPPYQVEESGFAGFIMPIDVYFRNREEPKTVRFDYDLFLHVESMPPVNHTRLEKLTFMNPTEDFRKKLLDAGALLLRPLDRHSTKEQLRDSPSSHPKKDRTKQKEHSKRREGSSHHDDKKKSSISTKKEGRIAAKDIKRHEDEFKHPKVPESTKSSKDVSQDSSHRERGGRSKKKRPATEIESSKKKKKKHSSPSLHPQESRPKSLSIPSTSSTKKEKVRKIKEKPDLMAGLFAPENSINMSHIKQSKDKIKAEPNSESRSKKEKRSSALTPTGSSNSPRFDEHVRTTSKCSTSGNLTLKIKKDKLSPNTEKDSKKELQSVKRQEKIKTDKRDDSTIIKKHKKRIKENPEVTKVQYQDRPKRISPIISSSSSGSDMEISNSSSDSSPERPPKLSSKSSHRESKTSTKSQKTLKKRKKVASTLEKIDKKNSSQSIVNKSEKIKFEKIRNREESPSVSRSKDRSKTTGSPRPQGSSKLAKKTDKKESKIAESREKTSCSEILKKSKKDKSSSREKEEKLPKDAKRSKISMKEVKTGSNQSSERSKTDSKSPPAQKSTPAVINIKPKKSSKSPSRRGKEKHIHRRQADKKASKPFENVVTKSQPAPKSDVKKTKKRKERSFIPSDSSDDDEANFESHVFETDIPPHHSPIDGGAPYAKRARKDSASSSSSLRSAASSASENMPGHSSSSSSSSASSDEEELQKIHATATITEPAVSPIDSAYNSYQNVKASYSGDSSSPVQDNISQPSEIDSVLENSDPAKPVPLISSVHDMDVRDHDLYTTSDEDTEFESQPPEKPFQDNDDAAFEDEPLPEEPANIVILTGETETYPHLTQEMYLDLQELQKKLSYVTDVQRLSKIANIVHRSRKLSHNDDYLDFDLCALDKKTIRRIKRELKVA